MIKNPPTTTMSHIHHLFAWLRSRSILCGTCMDKQIFSILLATVFLLILFFLSFTMIWDEGTACALEIKLTLIKFIVLVRGVHRSGWKKKKNIYIYIYIYIRLCWFRWVKKTEFGLSPVIFKMESPFVLMIKCHIIH